MLGAFDSRACRPGGAESPGRRARARPATARPPAPVRSSAHQTIGHPQTKAGRAPASSPPPLRREPPRARFSARRPASTPFPCTGIDSGASRFRAPPGPAHSIPSPCAPFPRPRHARRRRAPCIRRTDQQRRHALLADRDAQRLHPGAALASASHRAVSSRAASTSGGKSTSPHSSPLMSSVHTSPTARGGGSPANTRWSSLRSSASRARLRSGTALPRPRGRRAARSTPR